MICELLTLRDDVRETKRYIDSNNNHNNSSTAKYATTMENKTIALPLNTYNKHQVLKIFLSGKLST